MKKNIGLKFNHKFINIVICISACIIIMSISFEETTFAWLYKSTFAISESEFETAKVSVEYTKDNVQNLEFINFRLNDISFARKLIALETDLAYTTNKGDEWNNAFKTWWDDNGNNASNNYLVPSNRVMLGNVITKEYTFKNTSSIPVYLRVKTPEVTNNSVDIAYFIDVKDNAKILEGTDGYWYFLEPLMINDTVTLEAIAYVPQLANALKMNFIGSVDIFIDHAEVIQATNNAVYYANGWKLVADNGLFESYIK